MPAVDEGVIQFAADHEDRDLDADALSDAARPLLEWRQRLFAAGVIGQDPRRYQGAGFGNLSVRLPAAGRLRPFLITGTQTGGRPSLSLAELCVVTRYDLGRNRVESHGRILPSSEAMTHGAMYDLSRGIRFVFHGHSPGLWRAARSLRVPTTHPEVGYGTPEMAAEVTRLVRRHPGARLLAMGGHEDGIVAFGPSAHETGRFLLRQLAEASR